MINTAVHRIYEREKDSTMANWFITNVLFITIHTLFLLKLSSFFFANKRERRKEAKNNTEFCGVRDFERHVQFHEIIS